MKRIRPNARSGVTVWARAVTGGSPGDPEGPGGPDPGRAGCPAWDQDPAAPAGPTVRVPDPTARASGAADPGPAGPAQVSVQSAPVSPAQPPPVAEPPERAVRAPAVPGQRGRSPERPVPVAAPDWPEPPHFSRGWAAYRPMDGYRAPARSSAPQHRRRKPSLPRGRPGTADDPAQPRRPKIAHPRQRYRSRARPARRCKPVVGRRSLQRRRKPARPGPLLRCRDLGHTPERWSTNRTAARARMPAPRPGPTPIRARWAR